MSGFVRLAAVRDFRQRTQRAGRALGRRRRILPLLALLFLAAASPRSRPLPIPPIPPSPPNDAPAPVPDRDASAPQEAQTTGPKIVPRLLQVPSYQNQFDASAGYVTGSRVQEDQTDRRFAPSPGFRLVIPLR
jgi:hypothetical protein